MPPVTAEIKEDAQPIAPAAAPAAPDSSAAAAGDDRGSAAAQGPEASSDDASAAAGSAAASAAPAPAHQQHKQRHRHAEQRKAGKKRRALGATLLAAAIVALFAALAVPRAAKDERVRAAVSDSVQRLNNTLVEQFDVSLDGFLERLSNISDTVSSIMADDRPRPGQVAAALGLRAHHPVIIVPGFVTSGLELWAGEPCAQTYFRQRLWGTLSMAQTLLADRACWLRHMKLDPVTGSDPPGIKLRAAKALEAVDFFVPGYWVFAKLVQSLADIGYDSNTLVAVPYDWRLPIPVLESRDGYFTRVKREVELQHKLARGVQPLLVSHSYGALVTLAFMSWVERVEPGWVDAHLRGYVNLAGPLLGLPKALSPLMSGETRETVDMMAGLAVLVEQYLGKQSRASLFRTWGSVMAMLPVGGPRVWGNATHAPDDDATVTSAGRSYGGIVAEVNSADTKLKEAVGKNDSNLLSSESLQLLSTTLSNWGALIKSLGTGAADEDKAAPGSDADAAYAVRSEAKAEAVAAAVAEAEDAAAAVARAKTGARADEGEGEQAQEPEQAQEQGQDEAQDVASSSLAHNGLPVSFLDIDGAIVSLALTGGEQFTRNLQRWSPAARSLDLSHVLDQQRRAAAAAAAQHGSCDVRPGEYQGRCEAGGAAADGSRGGGDDAPGNGRGCTCSNEPGAARAAQCDDAGQGADSPACSGGDSDSADTRAAASSTSTSSSAAAAARDARSDASGGGEPGDPDSDPQAEVPPVNPLRTPLPKAPRFSLYCLYGVGSPTERGYHYLKTLKAGHTEWSVNSVAHAPASGLESGVQLSPDGDGTVPLLSLGALCAGGWRTRRLNPSGLEVVVREYPNLPVPVLKDSRGGPNASTHVEILGNEPMLLDLLHIAAGRGSSVGERYHTDIRRIAANIPWDEL